MKGSPEEWAREVDLAYHIYMADRVIVETNNGGALLRALFKSTNRMLPITDVFAKRSKILRAEPIAATTAATIPALMNQVVLLMRYSP